METRSGWQELTTDRKKQCPKLFYKYEADENGYQLLLTDLIALWTSRGSANDVRDYAKLHKTSIDESQLRVLLRKLSQSLAEGHNVLKKDQSSDSETVLLQTTLTLPQPLEPLRWEFTLEKQGSGEMAESILRPCLYEASESTKKIETLFSTIEAKDRVISRLLEKIEGSNLDLGLIFPGVTGPRARRGGTTLRDAEWHVAGLRRFDKREWQEFFKSDGGYASFETAGMLKLAVEKCPKHTPQQHEKWLEKLPKASATASQMILRSSSPVRYDTDSENEFETQKKPTTAYVPQGEGSILSDTEPDEAEPSKRQKTLPVKQRPRLRHASSQSSQGSSPPPLPPQPSKPPRSHSTSSTATDATSDQDVSNKPKARIGKDRKSVV